MTDHAAFQTMLDSLAIERAELEAADKKIVEAMMVLFAEGNREIFRELHGIRSLINEKFHSLERRERTWRPTE